MKAGLDPIKFGTSGWRARIADTYTFANVRRLTRAIADHLKDTGGMSLRGHPPEKDGILACLLAAETAAVEGAALGVVPERLYAEVGRLLSVRVNVPLSDAVRRALPARMAEPPAALGPWSVKRVQTMDGLKLHLDGGARVLVRSSGTEPVARLDVEAPDVATLEALRDAALRHFFA